MAKSKTSFQKGHRAVSPGRPALPEIIKEKSRETKPQIIESYHRLAMMPYKDFKGYEPLTAIDAGIKKCISNFVKTGKTAEIRHIWAECHGKPVESIDANISLDRIVIRRIKPDDAT
jgi:hypothetical protein